MGTTVLTVGEALISLTPIGGSSLQDAEQLYVSAAGAELNVAVHLARLGVPTRLASSVGDDPMGRRLRASLGRAGVDTTFLEADPVRPTAVYLKDPQAATAAVYYYRAGSAASAYREVPAAAWADVGHVHLSGITPALSAECLKLVDSLLSQARGSRPRSMSTTVPHCGRRNRPLLCYVDWRTVRPSCSSAWTRRQPSGA